MPSPRRQPAPLAILSLFLLMAALALAAALVLQVRAGRPQGTPAQSTVLALQTALAGERAQAAAQRTEIAGLRSAIARLQRGATQTPVSGSNGRRVYVVSFQLDKYSYILYMEWVESNGFVRGGRLLTADNSVPSGQRSFTFTGLDNNGSYGFTGTDGHTSMTFTGTANGTGTFTVSGLPWSVFSGFVGGTFSQTLHPGTLDEFTASVANLAPPPR